MPFKRGIVGMARTGNRNSRQQRSSSSCSATPRSSNGQYTVIGEVVSGMDVVDKLKKGAEAASGTVSNPDKIMKVQVAADAK